MSYIDSDMLMADIKLQLSSYHTSKILSGRGLEDDPDWVEKFEELIDTYGGK